MKKSRERFIGKTVLSEKGIPIGVIKESLCEDETGNITSLLITPSNNIDPEEYQQDKDGKIVIPIHNLSPVQDVVVCEKNMDLSKPIE